MANHLTDMDRQSVASFLRDWGYASLEEWAADDGEYYYADEAAEWFQSGAGPWAPVVDLEVACFKFIETQGELQDEQRYGFA